MRKHNNYIELVFMRLRTLISIADDDETDPDVLSDPLYHLNLKDYLIDFIKSFSQTQFYETFRVSLSSQEHSVLHVVGVGTT